MIVAAPNVLTIAFLGRIALPSYPGGYGHLGSSGPRCPYRTAESYWEMVQVRGRVAVRPWSALVALVPSSWTYTS